MRVSAFATAAAAVALVQVNVSAAANAPRINGWYPCHDSMASPVAKTAAPAAVFECAEVEVPLCHESVCKSSKTINLFVKRLPAQKPTKPRKALWFLQGGPGYSSATLESSMKSFATGTGGAVDLYTLDHRGTGRSNYLECQAAQAFAAGGPDGVGLNVAEIPNCVRDIMFQIDNKTEAFSVTSAATDVTYLIDALNGPDADVYVYGGSYGTYWASRVMHLAPKQVKGYILDGVVDEKSATFTTWNENRRYAEARYLKMCEKDKFCSSKLAKEIKTHGSLSAAVTSLYKTLDTAAPGKNKCADALRSADPTSPPSRMLKSFLGPKIQWDPTRVVIPALLHRMYNCAAKDVAFLEKLLSTGDDEEKGDFQLASTAPAVKDLVMSNSDFLSALIKASEMWSTPSPSWNDALKSFDAGLFSTATSFDYTMVCFLRGNFKDPVCDHVVKSYPQVNFSQFKTPEYVYKPDAYWHKYARIPSHASAMVINGGLDFQTPSEWGTAEYEGLGAGEKMLVEFETGVHCAGISQQTASDASFCGYHIISSYVLGGGKVDKVDTTCMKKLPAFNFADLKAIQQVFPNMGFKSVDELYDSK